MSKYQLVHHWSKFLRVVSCSVLISLVKKYSVGNRFDPPETQDRKLLYGNCADRLAEVDELTWLLGSRLSTRAEIEFIVEE